MARAKRALFFPKADAAVLSSRHKTPPPTHPPIIWPIYDAENFDEPIAPWPSDAEESFYPKQTETFAPASIPKQPSKCLPDRYLRAFLAENERLRSSMVWYYSHHYLDEAEFLSGLQEKACMAQESTGWEFAVIGILDVNYYIRLASVGLPLAVLPRGETICAHTVTQPPGSVFLLPNMMEDWRFKDCPYVESGGLHAYAGAPLRLQHESGECVGIGSLCVASRTSQQPLTKLQQQTLVRLADWVVSDLVQCTRARRQRERRRMTDLIATLQSEADTAESEEPVLRILRATYKDASICLQSSKAAHIEIEGQVPIRVAELQDGLWEDTDYIDDFIANSNQRDFPSARVVRILAAQCETMSGASLLLIASKDFRLVFDDIDSWFVETCAGIISQIWNKCLLSEVMRAKEKFLRGFSHQLRTPLHGILGSVELLAEELRSRGRSISGNTVSLHEVNLATKRTDSNFHLDTIKLAGRDLISIVNSMITLNRWADIAMSDRHYAAYTLSHLETELAQEIRKLTSGDTRYRASVFFDFPPDLGTFRVDLGLLRDSLLPLVINAIQNTQQGIVVVTASLKSESKELTIDVEDTGCGIPLEHQQRIFDPYEKVEIHTAGAGLGLTLASKAVFHEIECSPSPASPRAPAQDLKHLPSSFFNMKPNLSGMSLCDCFSRFLTLRGFKSSDCVYDSLTILDYMPDLEQHQLNVSKIPTAHVAICLVPASQEGSGLDSDANFNIIYVRGPFLTSTMSRALEEADIRLSEMATSHASQSKPESTPGLVDPGPTIEEEAGPSVLSTRQPSRTPMNDVEHIAPAVALAHEPVANGPVHSEPVVPVSPAIAPAMPTALLVDDNIVNLRILQMYCAKRKLPYHSATDGLQAVEIFQKQQALAATGGGAGIQLILMDLQMPVCDGIEATRRIRNLEKQNKWTESALFIVTGQDSPKDRTTAQEIGANEYFVKPVGLKILDAGVAKFFPTFGAG